MAKKGGGSSSGGSVSVSGSKDKDKNTDGGGYTGVRDMFDGGGPGQSGDTFGGALGGVSNAVGATPLGSGEEPSGLAGAVSGNYTGVPDMFDGGGPGQSGKVFQGTFGGVSNTLGATPVGSGYAPTGVAGAVSGSYTGVPDMVNGGGPGQAGSTFGGTFGGVSNAAGLTPLGSGIAPTGVAGMLGGGTNLFARGMASNGALPLTAGATGAERALRRGVDDEEEGQMRRRLMLEQRRQAERAVRPEATNPDDNLTGEEVSRRNALRSMVPEFEEGGMVGPGGTPIRPSTAQIPEVLQGLMRPSYAEGGMVGPGGVPQRPMTSPVAIDLAQRGGAPVMGLAPPGGTARPLNFAAIDMEAQRFMQQNPQQVQQIQAEVQNAMASGEVDAAGLNLFVNVATAALQNPDLWPQLRQALINQGLVDANEIGTEYDQGFLITLYIVGKTMGGQMPGQPAAPQDAGMQTPMSAGQPPQMSMSEGGPLPAKSENPDGSIPINAHEGEYVIPADVTRKLGTDHFDKLIAKARGVNEKGER